MLVPQYWAEAKVRGAIKGKPLSVHRFGWSDSNEAAAQQHAEQRAREALQRLQAGEALTLREKKMPYNGAEGLPIREEIVERMDTSVVTRNSYGVRCLNTPNVLFIDIDLPEAAPKLVWLPWLLATGIALIAARIGLPFWAGLISALMVLTSAKYWLGRYRAAHPPQETARQQAEQRIAQFVESHPDWSLRVYHTPAGLRVLVMHRTFDPTESAVEEVFSSLKADPVYQLMCRNQRCFRARVSAKPWRIGMKEPMRPTRSVWPIKPERLAERQQWVQRYESAAQMFAACRFVQTYGPTPQDSTTLAVQQWHDHLCRATTQLPLA